MATGVRVGVGGAVKTVKGIYVGVGGQVKKVTKGYVGVGGVPKLFWSGGEVEYGGTITNLPTKQPRAHTNIPEKFAVYASNEKTVLNYTLYNTSLTKTEMTGTTEEQGSSIYHGYYKPYTGVHSKSIGYLITSYAYGSNNVVIYLHLRPFNSSGTILSSIRQTSESSSQLNYYGSTNSQYVLCSQSSNTSSSSANGRINVIDNSGTVSASFLSVTGRYLYLSQNHGTRHAYASSTPYSSGESEMLYLIDQTTLSSSTVSVPKTINLGTGYGSIAWRMSLNTPGVRCGTYFLFMGSDRMSQNQEVQNRAVYSISESGTLNTSPIYFNPKEPTYYFVTDGTKITLKDEAVFEIQSKNSSFDLVDNRLNIFNTSLTRREASIPLYEYELENITSDMGIGIGSRNDSGIKLT